MSRSVLLGMLLVVSLCTWWAFIRANERFTVFYNMRVLVPVQ